METIGFIRLRTIGLPNIGDCDVAATLNISKPAERTEGATP